MLQLLLYPLGILVLMFPVPGFILTGITLPLQMVATKLAEHLLDFLGYSVLREGNVLLLPGMTLNVAEACSGLRSIMALTFLGQAYTYLFDSRPWMRAVMGVLVIPIAVVANSLRIVISAIASSYNPQWGKGVYHDTTGWGMFVISFAFIVGTHIVVTKIARKVKSR